MIRILVLFFVIIAAIVLGPTLVGQQGKVIVEVAGQSIQTSVTSLGIMTVVAFCFLAAVWLIIKRIFKLGSNTKNWLFDSKSDKAERMTQAALLKLIEGDFSRAEKLLATSAPNAPQPVINYLLAAESAQRRRDVIMTNQYLANAAKVAGENQIPVDITRIRIQLEHGEYDLAKQGVEQLLNTHPRHPEVLRLAQKTLLASGSYQEVLELYPTLRKADILTDSELDKLRYDANVGMIQAAFDKGGIGAFKNWWSSFPKRNRNNELRTAAATLCLTHSENACAEEIILEGLKHEYSEELVLLLPKLESKNLDQLEQVLWKLIKKQGETPVLNSVLGQLLIQHGNWESASQRLHSALEQHPNPQDYALLADTYDHLAQTADADKMRREALQLTLEPSNLAQKKEDATDEVQTDVANSEEAAKEKA